MVTNTQRITDLEKWRTQHTADHAKGVIHSHPVVVPPPTTGIPPTPTDHDLLLRDFSDGTLGEFRKVTYLDAKPADGMRYATDYTHPISWPSDGGRPFLRQRCIAQNAAHSRYYGTFLSTGAGMGPATFNFSRGYLEAAFRLPGVGKVGTWPAPLWLVDTLQWSSREIDLGEVLEDQKLRFTLHGYGAEDKMISLPLGDVATAWHRVGIAIANDHFTITYDGVEIVRRNVVIDRPLSVLTDAKAGYAWVAGTPNLTTPAEFDVDLAWIVASSKIPAGL